MTATATAAPPAPGRSSSWPRSGDERRLVLIALIDSLGSGAFMAASVVLFTRLLGLSAVQIGTAIAVAGVAGMAFAVPWGITADRFGTRRVLQLLQLWRAIGFLGYVLVDDFTGYLVVTLLLGLAEKASPPLTTAVAAATVEPDRRVQLLAYLRSVRNVGFTAGSLLATLAVLAGDRTALLLVVCGNAATFVFAAAMLGTLRARQAPPAASRTEAGAPLRRRPWFCLSALLSGAISIHRPLLAIGLPLWLIGHTSAPPAMVTVLIAVNTVLVMLLQVRFSRRSDAPVEAARQLRLAAVMLAGFALLISVSAGAGGWVVIVLPVLAVLALTCGELWHSAGSWGLSLALSPERFRGRFLTAFNLGVNAVDVTGAVLITAVVLPAGMLGWIGLAAVLAALGAAAVPVSARAEREAQQAAPLHHSQPTP
ncbi:putative MFS family arabinose efflux permease [Allocatelliglobosispora scoriae]|uniref:Putative MFS family arabinose efflux permease n=1 Tax=Allocatelliglobosispora scoriae TaxID=643052 RepID=A0A841BHT4_9ACTN|nr:MFS transporter [Allocatelliglobosispora scoriae]MBB5867185.1 putative MFS family arabinose efflux permease [Allocatelliglobosispora scoriae]